MMQEPDVPLNADIVKRLKVKSVTGYTNNLDKVISSISGYRSLHIAFDVAGNKTKELHYNANNEVHQEKLFDSSGKIIKAIFYKDLNQLDYELRYEYDDAGILNKKSMYLGGDILFYYFVCEKDYRHRIIREICYDAQGKIIRVDSFEYDEQNRLIKEKLGHLGEITYRYQKDGYLTQITGNLASSDILGDNYEFHYDYLGLPLEAVHIKRSITKYEYEFY